MKFIKDSHWIFAEAADEIIMMNVVTNTYIGLPAIGSRIWSLLDTADDVDAICAELRREYDVDVDDCRRDVLVFLQELIDHGVISHGAADGS